MPTMIIRIRSAEGTRRLEVLPTDRVYSLERTLRNLYIDDAPSNATLIIRREEDPAGLNLFRGADCTKSLEEAGIGHGALLYLTMKCVVLPPRPSPSLDLSQEGPLSQYPNDQAISSQHFSHATFYAMMRRWFR